MNDGMSAPGLKQEIKTDRVDLEQWGTRVTHKEIESREAFRVWVGLYGRIGSAYHEEMARAVHNSGVAFTVRSIQSIERCWPGPDGGAVLFLPR